MAHTVQEKIIIGLKIRQLRIEAGWGFEELSRRSGISLSYLNEIEKGKKFPGSETLQKIAKTFQISTSDLTSGSLGKQMAPIGELIESNFLDELPFELFGISNQQVVEIMARAPERVHAFISAMLEIARNYSVRQESFFMAALRAYQEMHLNYFPEIEQHALDFMEHHQLTTPGSASAERLEEILFEDYGCEIDDTYLGQFPELEQLRSVFQPKKKKLLLQAKLLEPQRAFQIAKEIGFQSQKLKKRPVTSSLLRVNSFDQVWNNYIAAYFAVCLLVPKQEFIGHLRAFFSLPKWHPDELLKIMGKYRVGPEVFFQRFNVLGTDFDIKNVFFLRMIHNVQLGTFEIDKELHLNCDHSPRATGGEWYCRRWLNVKLFKELNHSDNVDRLKAGAARMIFVDNHNAINAEYLCISVVKAGHPNPDKQVSIIIGMQLNDALKKHVAWWNDPHIEQIEVGGTCDRCPIELCEQRMVEPTFLQRSKRRKKAEETIKTLTE